jgi:hypothetical protein
MRMCWIVFQKTLPSVPVPVFTVIAPFAVTLVCIGVYKVLNFLIPVQLDWALGARGGKAQIKARAPATVERLKNTG